MPRLESATMRYAMSLLMMLPLFFRRRHFAVFRHYGLRALLIYLRCYAAALLKTLIRALFKRRDMAREQARDEILSAAYDGAIRRARDSMEARAASVTARLFRVLTHMLRACCSGALIAAVDAAADAMFRQHTCR